MTIFYVNPNSYNNLSVYDYSLVQNIHSETYFFGSTNYDFRQFSKAKVNLIYTYNRYNNKYLKSFFYAVNTLKLLWYIFTIRPDIIHIQWLKLPYFDIIWLNFIKLFIKKSKIVYTAHNILPHDSGKRYYNIFKYIYFLVNGIIVHSQYTYNELINDFNIDTIKVRVIEHGILDFDISQSKLDHIIHKLKEELKIRNDETVFLAIGKVSYYKGYDLLIRAWSQSDYLCNSRKTRLIIAGKGNISNINNIHLPNNINIVNKFLSNEEFMGLIIISDIIVFPYRQISQSGVLATVINYERFLIVSKSGGLPDIFKIGNVGTTFNSLRIIDIEKKIIEVLENKRIPKQEEWKKIREYFSFKRIAKKTELFYTELINS